MIGVRQLTLPVALLLAASGCTRGDPAASAGGGDTGEQAAAGQATTRLPVVITGAQGSHTFVVELAKTAGQQEQGLMYRTDLKPDGGMLFWPYPPDGSGARAAEFWMKNTPTPLDIAFIRADGTIARLAENTVPFSETRIPSGEPVVAVLELVGGRAAELGIAEGDRVSWPGRR